MEEKAMCQGMEVVGNSKEARIGMGSAGSVNGVWSGMLDAGHVMGMASGHPIQARHADVRIPLTTSRYFVLPLRDLSSASQTCVCFLPPAPGAVMVVGAVVMFRSHVGRGRQVKTAVRGRRRPI